MLTAQASQLQNNNREKLKHHLQTGTMPQSPQREQKAAGWGDKVDFLFQTSEMGGSDRPKSPTRQESMASGAVGKETTGRAGMASRRL